MLFFTFNRLESSAAEMPSFISLMILIFSIVGKDEFTVLIVFS
jgi:hypothetical protein